ncbi:hypothetical protein DAPPUDRAFT_242993 [Daphnia pulex]|uniref:Ig-like domain-containing protein n=1 Tax=Daphnia pulex TaxID=6669 RepID=E9GHV2_DAPPU|nr:hypothetical protein DAPPUDRAFT_242993 [Daphnia pulex]|eukprot:EFX80985.1 hypothetical protein DAPPUDRAFT_242993 [Daphnia pulex]
MILLRATQTEVPTANFAILKKIDLRSHSKLKCAISTAVESRAGDPFHHFGHVQPDRREEAIKLNAIILIDALRRNDPFICSGLSTFTSEAFQTTSASFPCRPACRRNSTAQKRGPHLMMATTGLLVVLARQLFIYSLLIVANESKRIEKIAERNQDGERLLRLRKHSCVSSSRAGHLGALPGLFADHHQQQDGCDHDHGPAPSFSAPQNGSTVKGHHGAPAQLHCNIQDLHHRATHNAASDRIGAWHIVREQSHLNERPNPHLWQLKFNPAMINDSGTYLCHISTDPPLIRYIHLEISAARTPTAQVL